MTTMTQVETQAPARVQIRWLIRRDMPEVLAIEAASFDHPWCEEDLVRALRQPNQIGMVAECGDRIVGFMIYQFNRNKINVLDFAVHPEFRRRGVGSRLVEKLASKLSGKRYSRINCFVREGNLAGQLFLRSLGLRAVLTFRQYYGDTGEDGYKFSYVLPVEEPVPA